jgi:hypothetical protein
MDLSEIFNREAPEFMKPFLEEGAVWGPFVIELPSGNLALGSQLRIEDGSASWIDTQDIGRSTSVKGEPEEGEDKSSVIIETKSDDRYVFRTLREDDWEDLGMEAPGSLEEVNNFADELFAPFELEDDEEE